MKKLPILLSLILVFSLMLSPLASAAGSNTDTLADWDIRIAVPDEAAAAVLEGNVYYIYAQHEGYIPYVMLTATGRFSSEEEFIDYMNESMAAQYAAQDFRITSPAALKTVGDKLCYEVDYAYTISGLDAVDRRIFITAGDLTYMFASKEIPSRNMTVGTMLEDVVADCVFLVEDLGTTNDPGSPEEDSAEAQLYDAYLYCQEDGMPKYWLDLTGALDENPVLHCYFRSGDPTFYESCLILDFETAEADDNSLFISKIYDMHGNDVSDWFTWFVLEFYTDGIVMDVERDEKTLAGGAEDNLLTGTYLMEPAAAAISYDCSDEDGSLQFWLTWAENGDAELHSALSSGGDPETYDEVYLLEAETAEQTGEYVTSYSRVYKNGSDISKWFKSVVLTQAQASYILTVKRDEKTLVDPEDPLLTGSYTFDAVVRFFPPEVGPYTAGELAVLAQRYYFVNTGFFPPETEVTENEDGSFTVHLYEVVTADETEHTATSAWYTVDSFGVGVDDITGEEVYLAG